MDFGMLWYDDDTRRGLDEKVARAAAHYRSKYGMMPNVCFVHPTMLGEGVEAAGGLPLQPSQLVMINHFWLGVDELAGHSLQAAGRRPN